MLLSVQDEQRRPLLTDLQSCFLEVFVVAVGLGSPPGGGTLTVQCCKTISRLLFYNLLMASHGVPRGQHAAVTRGLQQAEPKTQTAR